MLCAMTAAAWVMAGPWVRNTTGVMDAVRDARVPPAAVTRA
jgi:hypothetical protein